MTWTGYNEALPLIFMHKRSMGQCRRELSMELPQELERLVPDEEIGLDLMLLILTQNNCIEAAVRLLCYALTPREAVWWGICCYRFIKEKEAADFAQDGLTPQQRRMKGIDDLVEKLSDRADIDQAVADNLERQAQQAEDYKQALQEASGETPSEKMQNLLKNVLAIAQSYTQILPDEQRAAWEKSSPQSKEFLQTEIDRILKERSLSPELELSEADAAISGEAITKMLKEKTGAIKPAIDAEMAKHFPLQLRGLPQAASEQQIAAALSSALTWLLNPTDVHGYHACQAAIAAKSGPESMLAYCAFWSSSLMVSQTGQAPGNPALPPRGLISLLAELAAIEIDEFDYDARYDEFLRMGIACAQGTSTWDLEGQEIIRPHLAKPVDDSNLKSRYGFGRSS